MKRFYITLFPFFFIPLVIIATINKDSIGIPALIILSIFISSVLAGAVSYIISKYLRRLEKGHIEVSAGLRSSIERFKKEKEQMEAILFCMDEGVIAADPKGNITLVNRKAEELFGAGNLGKRIIEILRNSELHRIISEGEEKGKTVSGEITISHRPLHLLVTMTPLVRDKEILGSILVFHDITLLKRLETTRIDFIANVSHELKTPLTAIRGFVETLADGALDDRENALRFIGIIKNNAERLTRLVEDLLTLSNIELGKVNLYIEEIDAHEVADAVISTLTPMAKRKGIGLKSALKEGTIVLADKDRLAQILFNLIDNAIKFTDKGDVTVSSEEAAGRVFISVTDTGIGIPSKDIHRVGERFYRVDSARSRELGGTGLGLAIVKHLVTSMNGRLIIGNGPIRGTKVSFTLSAASVNGL